LLQAKCHKKELTVAGLFV